MKKTAQTGQHILEALASVPLTTRQLVNVLEPLLSHVRDPNVAVRSALSKLKIAGKIAKENGAWHLLDSSPVSRGGAREGAGRHRRTTKLVALTIKVERSVLEDFKSSAREGGATQAGLFTLWVKNGCPVR